MKRFLSAAALLVVCAITVHAQTIGPAPGGGGGGGTPGGANGDVQFNSSGSLAGDAGFTYGGNGQATLALGAVTSNLTALAITATWNSSGTTFDAPLFMNVTNTASASGSLLMDLQVGGATKFSVDKTGIIATAVNGPGILIEVPTQNTVGMGRNSSIAGLDLYGAGTSSPPINIGGSTITLANSTLLAWSSSNVTQPVDTGLARSAANVLEINDGTAGTGPGILKLAASTFSALPTPAAGDFAYISDGKASNCGDSSCTTWGTTVTAGAGALKLFIWYNGANWTLAGK